MSIQMELVHSPCRLELEMEALSTHLAEIAHPFVKKALEAELLNVGAEAWKEEGERALRTLLHDENILDAYEPGAFDVLESLRQSLEHPIAPDGEEIHAHATEVGTVMASAWLQFLALAIRKKEELVLDETLLPRKEEVRDELWEALRGSLNSLVIDRDEAPRIMKAFAEDVVAGTDGVDLPMGVGLDTGHAPQPSYVARRR